MRNLKVLLAGIVLFTFLTAGAFCAKIKIRSHAYSYERDTGTFFATGEVVVQHPDFSLESEALAYNVRDRRGKAEGNCHLLSTDGKLEVWAPVVLFDLQADTYVATGEITIRVEATGEKEPQNVFVKASWARFDRKRDLITVVASQEVKIRGETLTGHKETFRGTCKRLIYDFKRFSLEEGASLESGGTVLRADKIYVYPREGKIEAVGAGEVELEAE